MKEAVPQGRLQAQLAVGPEPPVLGDPVREDCRWPAETCRNGDALGSQESRAGPGWGQILRRRSAGPHLILTFCTNETLRRIPQHLTCMKEFPSVILQLNLGVLRQMAGPTPGFDPETCCPFLLSSKVQLWPPVGVEMGVCTSPGPPSLSQLLLPNTFFFKFFKPQCLDEGQGLDLSLNPGISTYYSCGF